MNEETSFGAIPSTDCIRHIIRLEAAIDGQVVGIHTLANRLATTRAWILDHFNPADPITYAAAVEFDRIFSGIREIMTPANELPSDVRGYRQEIAILTQAVQPIMPEVWQRLEHYVRQVTGQLNDLAQTIVSESGECDIRRYQELMTRIRTDWQVGSEAFFTRLLTLPVGYCEGRGASACDIWSQGHERSFHDIRSRLSERLASSIQPACAGFAEGSPGEIVVEPRRRARHGRSR